MSKSLLNTIFKRFLDAGIVFYLILIPVILITGGIKIDLMGTSITATHAYTPFKFLIPLVFTRLLISLDFKNLLLVLGSVFFALLVMEFAIRIWDPPLAKPRWTHIHRASPVLGFELVPGAVGVGKLGETYRINSAGFRGGEVSRGKRQDVRRIAVIGDSFTFGAGVNVEDAYPAQLQQLLNQRNLRSEVMNFGVVNHDMWQHYEMLKARVLAYEPDLVILTIFTNDLESSIAPQHRTGDYEGSNPFEKRGARGVLRKSALWNFLTHATALFEYKYRYRQERYLRSISERKRETSDPDYFLYKIMTGKLDEKKSMAFSNTLRNFVATARDAGTKVLVVYIPDSAQLDELNLQISNRIVEHMTRELTIPFVDTTSFLEAEGDRESLYLFPFDAHNSPKGLRIIAGAIADKIVELALLQDAGSQSSIDPNGSRS